MASEAMKNQNQQTYVPLSKTRIKMSKFYRNWTNTMLKLKKEEINEIVAEANIIKNNKIHEEEKKLN